MAGTPSRTDRSSKTQSRQRQRYRPSRRSAATHAKVVKGFNFTEHMRRLCADATTRTPELQHIQMEYVAVSFNQTRKRVRHGMWASLTPMRFENGERETIRNGRRYTAQRLLDEHQREMLYILSFYLPRFMQLSFQDKLTTVFHELWHISPHFNGDIRRFPGRCFAHSSSEKEYDEQMERLSKKWLSLRPPPELYEFLKRKFGDLERDYGQVIGSRVQHPKLIPLE